MIINRTIADGTVIPNINRTYNVAHKKPCDIFDLNIVNPDNSTIRPCQINPKMAIGCLRTPNEVNTLAIPDTDNPCHLDNPTIFRQRYLRPGLNNAT